VSSLRERNRARTRAEIADAALTLFEQQGYEGTTVDQIAVAAGVSSATFFRYFATKEDVLFADEDEAAAGLVDVVRQRADRTRSVAALAAPVTAYATSLTNGTVPRQTRLVMSTRTLEARSLRIRLRWEQSLASELAREAGLDRPGLAETSIAAVAVSCLTSALRHWDRSGKALAVLVRAAFEHCTPQPTRSPRPQDSVDGAPGEHPEGGSPAPGAQGGRQAHDTREPHSYSVII
jgi:AcrR family transcriptional regulator